MTTNVFSQLDNDFYDEICDQEFDSIENEISILKNNAEIKLQNDIEYNIFSLIRNSNKNIYNLVFELNKISTSICKKELFTSSQLLSYIKKNEPSHKNSRSFENTEAEETVKHKFKINLAMLITLSIYFNTSIDRLLSDTEESDNDKILYSYNDYIKLMQLFISKYNVSLNKVYIKNNPKTNHIEDISGQNKVNICNVSSRFQAIETDEYNIPGIEITFDDKSINTFLDEYGNKRASVYHLIRCSLDIIDNKEDINKTNITTKKIIAFKDTINDLNQTLKNYLRDKLYQMILNTDNNASEVLITSFSKYICKTIKNSNNYKNGIALVKKRRFEENLIKTNGYVYPYLFVNKDLFNKYSNGKTPATILLLFEATRITGKNADQLFIDFLYQNRDTNIFTSSAMLSYLHIFDDNVLFQIDSRDENKPKICIQNTVIDSFLEDVYDLLPKDNKTITKEITSSDKFQKIISGLDKNVLCRCPYKAPNNQYKETNIKARNQAKEEKDRY